MAQRVVGEEPPGRRDRTRSAPPEQSGRAPRESDAEHDGAGSEHERNGDRREIRRDEDEHADGDLRHDPRPGEDAHAHRPAPQSRQIRDPAHDEQDRQHHGEQGDADAHPDDEGCADTDPEDAGTDAHPQGPARTPEPADAGEDAAHTGAEREQRQRGQRSRDDEDAEDDEGGADDREQPRRRGGQQTGKRPEAAQTHGAILHTLTIRTPELALRCFRRERALLKG